MRLWEYLENVRTRHGRIPALQLGLRSIFNTSQHDIELNDAEGDTGCATDRSQKLLKRSLLNLLDVPKLIVYF